MGLATQMEPAIVAPLGGAADRVAERVADRVDGLRRSLDAQRAAFRARPFPSLAQRHADLDRLLGGLVARKDAFVRALDEDFGGRSAFESTLTDIFSSIAAIKYARKNLAAWMRPRRRQVPLTLGAGKAAILPQPLGVIGIVAPWNFPLNLSLSPLSAALAAGDRVMIKPSEHTPATSRLLQQMIADLFAADHVAVFIGDAAVGRAFVSLPFDHLLYTGSTAIGREVMKAAAENLTPVTLELGGKSPALVAPDADLDAAAKDIAFGKLLNAGQICIAPDYALVPRANMAAFADAMRKAATRYYPAGAGSVDYTSIINDRQHQRLAGYLDEARRRGVSVVPLTPEGPRAVANDRRMAPMMVIDPPDDLAVMQEEVFGPILSVKPYETLDDAIRFIQDRPRPLALYLFTKSRGTIDRVMAETISGGVSINDTIMHNAVEDLPFGGVGASGMGHYHGREGFDTFSKLKPVFQRTGLRTDRMLRPPVKNLHAVMMRLLVGK